MSNEVPTPVSAVWSGGLPGSLALTMSCALEAGSLDPANYIAIHAMFNWTFSAAVASGAVVTLTPVQGSAAGADELMQYTPPPYDIRALLSDRRAEAFSTFPIT